MLVFYNTFLYLCFRPAIPQVAEQRLHSLHSLTTQFNGRQVVVGAWVVGFVLVWVFCVGKVVLVLDKVVFLSLPWLCFLVHRVFVLGGNVVGKLVTKWTVVGFIIGAIRIFCPCSFLVQGFFVLLTVLAELLLSKTATTNTRRQIAFPWLVLAIIVTKSFANYR